MRSWVGLIVSTQMDVLGNPLKGGARNASTGYSVCRCSWEIPSSGATYHCVILFSDSTGFLRIKELPFITCCWQDITYFCLHITVDYCPSLIDNALERCTFFCTASWRMTVTFLFKQPTHILCMQTQKQPLFFHSKLTNYLQIQILSSF